MLSFYVYLFFNNFSLSCTFHTDSSSRTSQLNQTESNDHYPETSLNRSSILPVPGLREFVSNTPELLESNKEVPEWLTGLDQEDVELLWSLGRLTSAQILEKVKELYNLAFELDIEEDKEMTRGKFLEVLERKSCEQNEEPF